MYAIFQYGGKQYKVSKNQIVCLEKLHLQVNAKLIFDKVLIIVDKCNICIGSPYVKGGKILAHVLSHNRDNKIVIMKFRRRKHYKRTQGHRQWFTSVKINDIFI